MDSRSHEFSYENNDLHRLVDIAIKKRIRLSVTYVDLSGKTTERELDPIEWIEGYKFKAYCHLRQAERNFVLSGIKKIRYIHSISNNQNENQPISRSSVTKLDQWRAAQATPTEIANENTSRIAPIDEVDLFSQVASSEQWGYLLSYYSECLNREFLQDYIIGQKHHSDYHFFSSDEDSVWKFLASRSSFTFPTQINNHPTDLFQFITNVEKRERQLCVGFPSILSPDGKIAPLFFTPCEIEQNDGRISIHPDEYELSYAILHSLDLDKEEFASIVEELSQFEFDDLAAKIKSMQTALVEKLGELVGYPVGRREATQSKLNYQANELMLFVTPCLFWASKNNITHALIQELEEIGKRPWEAVPRSVVNLLNSSPTGAYPQTTSFGRDSKVYVTRINDEQRRAVEAASEKPVTVVTGPPGTGKSQLVVNIIANAVMNGKSVLFASRNNRAVDVVVDRMKTEMRFPGIVRTGNRSVRKDAANTMLEALAKASRSHTLTDRTLLLDGYLKKKNALANQLDALHEIQRLIQSKSKKTQQFNSVCERFVPELSALLIDRKIDVRPDELAAAKQSATNLITTFGHIQKQKQAVETALQKHIADNGKNHSVIEDLESFELEWGKFGDGLRNADYFTTMSSLQHHLDLWTGFLDAVVMRLKIDKESEDVDNLRKKLNALLDTLPAELQIGIENLAFSISKDSLKGLSAQVKRIEGQMTDAQRRSPANWFGLRRGPQLKVISSHLNALLSDLGQSTNDEPPKLVELKSYFGTIRSYVTAIFYTRSLKVKENRLEQLEHDLTEGLHIFNEQTRQQFLKLRLQPVAPTELQKLLKKLSNEVEKAANQCNVSARAFNDAIESNASLAELWAEFRVAIGGEEYREWSFDDEISLSVLEHFASQWMDMLSAVEMKAELDQLTSIIQQKGSEQEISARVEAAQAQVTRQSIDILNNTWLQNIDGLRAERVQRVRDYASLIKETAENYDRQKYANMMSIQETYTDDIIAAFPVWATTNLSISRNLPLRSELFNVVIIDEASQCDIPSALPLIYRSKQVVIIGDAMQLRHIATLSEDSHQLLAAEKHVATEAYSYTRHSLFDLASRSVGQHPGILMLKEHYRSHEHIITFSNQAFYDSNLIIKTNMTNRQIPEQILTGGCGIFWLNVTGETLHPSGGSAKNQREINMIKRILPPLHQNMMTMGWDGSIGVVTPYREQKKAIQAWVDNQFGQQITVGTAHTFQGDEREILLFSPVLASGISDGSLSWLRRTKNLLNVAITRARTALIVVGDFNFCMSLSEDNPYRHLAEYVRMKPGAVCQSWEELPISRIENK